MRKSIYLHIFALFNTLLNLSIFTESCTHFSFFPLAESALQFFKIQLQCTILISFLSFWAFLRFCKNPVIWRYLQRIFWVVRDMPNSVGRVFKVTSDKHFKSIKFAFLVKYRIRGRWVVYLKFLHRWALGKLPKKQEIWQTFDSFAIAR